MTKGYTLLGRAKIRKLEINPSFYERTIKRIIQNRVSYDVKALRRIMDSIADASICYKKAAEASPEKDQICSACSTSMLCLSDMLDYMLAVIKKEKEVPKLEDEIKDWEKKLRVSREIYSGNPKGEAFIQSLDKLTACIKNLEEYKKSRMRKDERAFEECVRELREVAANIEGPIQKIIEESAKKMDICRRKYMPYTEIGNEYTHEYAPKPNRFSRMLKLIFEHPIIAAIIAGVIVIFIQKRYFP